MVTPVTLRPGRLRLSTRPIATGSDAPTNMTGVVAVATIDIRVWMSLAYPAYGLALLLLLGWTFAFFFHLCNGIRHLAWDTGWGFEIPKMYATGWTVIVASVVLTALTWAIALA